MYKEYIKMNTFKPTWLMIKQHNKTGLKYFCKTINKDPIKYKGSGTVWKRHLKVHGRDVTTVWCQLFTDKEEIQSYATKFSIDNDIVNKQDINGTKIWANIIVENGLDGGGNAGMKMAIAQKEGLCDDWLVITPNGTEEQITNMLQYCRQNKLNASAMSAVARGDRRHYKEYRCRKLTNNRNVKYEPKEPKPYLTEQEKKQINSNAVKQAKRKIATPKIKYNGIVYNTLIEAIEHTGISRYLLVKRGELLRND
jgi:hypothetical protein